MEAWRSVWWLNLFQSFRLTLLSATNFIIFTEVCSCLCLVYLYALPYIKLSSIDVHHTSLQQGTAQVFWKSRYRRTLKCTEIYGKAKYLRLLWRNSWMRSVVHAGDCILECFTVYCPSDFLLAKNLNHIIRFLNRKHIDLIKISISSVLLKFYVLLQGSGLLKILLVFCSIYYKTGSK